MAIVVPKFPPGRFEVIYADPPWDYQGCTQHNGKASTGGAGFHYPTVKLADLRGLEVASIAMPDAVLFMWSSSPHLDQAIALGRAWGFKYSTIAFVWHKVKKNPGFWTMSSCEVVLAFKRGKFPAPRGARNVEQFLSAPRRAHSAKPEEVRRRIEAMFPRQQKIELFARERCDGWAAWGLEVETKVFAESSAAKIRRYNAERL